MGEIMENLTLTAALAKALGKPSDEQVTSAVDDWLDDHPEATTTVEDGSITKAKLDSNLQGTVDDVGELKTQMNAVPVKAGTGNGSIVGPDSQSGYNNVASGSVSVAFGIGNTASSTSAFTAGALNTASGNSCAVFGAQNTASKRQSFAIGNNNNANGQYSFVGGIYSHTFGDVSFALGQRVVAKAIESFAGGDYVCSGPSSFSYGEGKNHTIKITGAANATTYSYTDNTFEVSPGCVVLYNKKAVKIHNVDYENHTFTTNAGETFGEAVSAATATLYVYGALGYCSQAVGLRTVAFSNQQYVFGCDNVPDHGNTYIEIVGNGSGDNARSNARTLDHSGNERLAGDLYVGCNTDSTGGTKLARIPDPPTTDGEYTLKATISNGAVTYTWVASA